MHLLVSSPTYHTPGKRGALDLISTGLVSPGVSLLLKELKHKLQCATLMVCIAQYSTKVRLVSWPKVQGKQPPKMSNPHPISTCPLGCGRWGMTLIGALYRSSNQCIHTLLFYRKDCMLQQNYCMISYITTYM